MARSPLTEHFKSQRARERQGFDETDIDRIAEPVGTLMPVTDQGVLRFDVVIVVIAERGRGNEPIGARFQQVGRTGRMS